MKATVQVGSFPDPPVITHVSRGRHVPCYTGIVYSGTVTPTVPHVSILPPIAGKPVIFPAMQFGEYAAAFPRYHKEVEKELNREFPEFYAPKSWFSKANQDKSWVKAAQSLERLSHREGLLMGRIQRDTSLSSRERKKALKELAKRFAQQRAAIMESTHHAAQLRAWGQAAIPTLKAWERAERKKLLKAWEGNNGPAMPRGGKYLKPHDSLRYLPIFTLYFQGEAPKDFYVEKVTHGSVTNGMEARSGRASGGGGFHNGNPMGSREERALELAQRGINLDRTLLVDVLKSEAEALKLAGQPGGKKAHKKALFLRRAYDRRKAELAEALRQFSLSGTMNRLKGFENSVGRTTRGKAASEKIKREGRKDYR